MLRNRVFSEVLFLFFIETHTYIGLKQVTVCLTTQRHMSMLSVTPISSSSFSGTRPSCLRLELRRSCLSSIRRLQSRPL